MHKKPLAMASWIAWLSTSPNVVDMDYCSYTVMSSFMEELNVVFPSACMREKSINPCYSGMQSTGKEWRDEPTLLLFSGSVLLLS